jgi:hypothetical protein
MSAPLAFLGLPSLHSIIEGIAKGFFGALAHALVPSWLTHGTVATIQHLVALPDPASWTHVGELQSDMVFLAAMLLPATLAIGTVRYWIVGLTGAAHPASALGHGVWVTCVLVAYRWIVEQVVAAANTLTHAVLGFPVVASGLQRIIGVLFGGALLSGVGGVFGAFLVIIGVLLAAGLFAAKVFLTVVLAGLTVAGPPLIALSPISELEHLSRVWAHALLATALVPFGWTVLFSTAGALCLDATSFTGGAGGVPGHVEAAFAGLITFALALLLPLMLLGSIRHMLVSAGGGAGGAQPQSTMPGAERVRAARSRLRAVALEGVPSLGRSAGQAAGALGTPAGGPLGAARRTLGSAARGVGGSSRRGLGAVGAVALPGPRARAAGTRRGVRGRLRSAGAVLAAAPREARAAVLAASARRSGTSTRATRVRGGAAAKSAPDTARASAAAARSHTSAGATPASAARSASVTEGPRPSQPAQILTTPSKSHGASRSTPTSRGGANPARRVQADAARDAARPPKAQGAPKRPPRTAKPPTAPPTTPPRAQRPGRRMRRKPRPRSGS